MAVSNGWGQGAVNNTNDWGKGKTTATNDWGKIYDTSASGDTNLGTAAGFSNVYSVNMDGIDQYIDCGNVTSLNGLANGSISMWFKTSNTSTQYLMSKWESSQKQFTIVVIPNTRIDVYGSSIGFRSTDSIALADGNWHHIAVTLEGGLTGNQRFKVYLDDTALTNVGFNGPTAFSTSTSDLVIGKRNDYAFYEWNGNLDEVSIWTKTLSSSEVTDIYNSGVPTDLTGEAGLANWWRMGDNDGGTGTTVTDQAGSNNGTLENSPTFQENVPS